MDRSIVFFLAQLMRIDLLQALPMVLFSINASIHPGGL
uniref:Uncharacterized protein n=1 Tax=Rhizophora mucronata TaxID=61149 RepID=A0A2P2PYF7_RHIMU